MTEIDVDQHCLYAELPNGIHAFALVRSSRRAVDELLEHIRNVYIQLPDAQRFYLIEIKTNIVPIFDYMSQQIRHLILNASPHRTHPHIAVLYDETSSGIMLQQMTHILGIGHVAVHYFPSRQRDEAIKWLLSHTVSSAVDQKG